ncbi:MAG: HD domain-containing protein [Candidatus Zambryskibacteria bacterium]|nr:HD domain-containing protein [Candidatus Zambryskibacteria bacterium]
MNPENLETKNNQIDSAKEFATKKFKEVGTGNHFLEVYEIMKDEFHVDDEEVLIAGLLHDTLEDTDTTYEEIENNFSKRVADLVEEVSHPKNYNAEQKKEYYEKIKHISLDGKMIKLADFASHLRKYIGAYTGTSNYPKSWNNGYIMLIRPFLDSCDESEAKHLVFEMTKELEDYIFKNPIEKPNGSNTTI